MIHSCSFRKRKRRRRSRKKKKDEDKDHHRGDGEKHSGALHDSSSSVSIVKKSKKMSSDPSRKELRESADEEGEVMPAKRSRLKGGDAGK